MKSIREIFVYAMRPLLCGFMAVAFAGAAMAGNFAGDTYINNSVVSYPGTEPFPPMIDATNFINNNQFIINSTTVSLLAQNFYETSDTVNYTNNNLMMANTGFRFDNRSSVNSWRTNSVNFVNYGTISCGSVNNLNDPFFGELFFFGLFPQCLVNATNIINPGIIDVGTDGLIKLTGQNVDLTRATLTIENAFGANIGGYGWYGLNTNFWDPSIFLQPTTAESAFFPVAPFFLFLPNSTAYFDFATPNPSNNIIRTVFIEDTSGPDVSYNVYFDTAGLGFGGGNVTIEWAGSYEDNATGNVFSNYLYLNDNYLVSASTNNGVLGGIPFAFTLTESPTKQIFQPAATAGFFPVFSAGSITNRYAFMNADLIATTEDTNNIPNHSVTNLPGRVEISATKDLDLSLAQITGLNYMSISSPTQFEGSAGATIFSPYSDINVGVTNGLLTISNLASPYVPTWHGNVQAWSTRWVELGTNFIGTNAIVVSNDFRVVIVGSQLNPSTLAQVQDMFLHASNSVVLADSINLMRNFSTDAQNLTLSQNGTGNGASSIEGDLNFENQAFDWQTSLPHLRNLTNNGAIRMANFQKLGTSAPVSITNTTITPGVNGLTATGRLAEVSFTNVALNDSVTIGTNKYTFVYSFSRRAVPNEVKIGSTVDQSMLNLIAAIDRGPGAGSVYSSKTVTNRQVFASQLSDDGSFAVTAKIFGSGGNLVTTTTSKRLTWDGHSNLIGGVDAIVASTNSVVTTTGGRYFSLVNNGVLVDGGSSVWADNFVNSGTFSNGVGSFTLFSLTATMTNDMTNVIFTAGGDISITADTLVISNTLLETDHSLTLKATNLLTDGGPASGNIWVVGTNSTGNGISAPIKPPLGDLLGTTITNYAPANRNVINIWSGNDVGASVAGFTNNLAVGRLVLDALGTAPNTEFTFQGSGNANAIYVDDLILEDSATNTDGSGNFPSLNIATNMVIYYAQAEMSGLSIAQKMNGKNGNRLRWVPEFVGQFSSIYIIYPDGSTNLFNSALADSTTVDSDGDGTANASDSTPFFTVGQMNVQTYVTNLPPLSMAITWDSIPSSTNIVTWSTNMSGPFNNLLTNFISPSTVPPAGGWPITNIVYDPIGSPTRFYNVIVIPNSTQFYGP